MKSFSVTSNHMGTIATASENSLGPAITESLVLLRMNGKFAVVSVSGDGLLSGPNFSFATPDCSGTPYMAVGSADILRFGFYDPSTGEAFAPMQNVPLEPVLICSFGGDESCFPQDLNGGCFLYPPLAFVPAEVIGTLHYTPPLHIE